MNQSTVFGADLFAFHKNQHKYINDRLVDFDLNIMQALFIIRLNNYPNTTQKELGEVFFLSKSAVAKSLKQLENKGFLKRIKNPHNKRFYNLQLTDKAFKIIPDIKKLNKKWEREMGFDKIDSSFFETFNDLVQKSIQLNDEVEK